MNCRPQVKGRRTPQVSSSGTGTISTFDALLGADRVNRNGVQTQIFTKIYNLCAMPVYEKKSMEELRLEDYIDNRKFPPPGMRFLFDGSTTNNVTPNIFGSNTATSSLTRGSFLFGNTAALSTSSFSFGTPITTTRAGTPFTFSSSLPTTYPRAPLGSFVPCTASVASPSLFTFGINQATATAPSFNFAQAVNEMKNDVTDRDRDSQSTPEKNCSRTPSPEIARTCVDCKNPPHMQCLHCSKHVCMDCAPKHITLATEQVTAAQDILNDKISILDRLSNAAKERVNAEREKIIQQLDTERDQACVQIDQLYEQQKKQIQDKSTQLNQLPLNKISSYIQRMTNETEGLTESNDQLFCVTCTLPKIQVQHKP